MDSMQNVLKSMMDANAMVEGNLVKFDTLDFTVFSNQDCRCGCMKATAKTLK